MDGSANPVPLLSEPRPASGAADKAVKAFKSGTHRVVAPAVTAQRVLGMQGPLGITRVANVTGLDCIGIPVVMVCRPNSRSLSVSQGKGIDLDCARASGLMECAELYHAERISHALKLATWNELRFSHELIQVDALPRTSVSNFSPDRGLLWIAGTELLSGGSRWLPYELVHTNYTLPLPTGSGCFVMSSNGLASGNHVLEAISHGLCEVIERDAAALFRFSALSAQEARRVDLGSIVDPVCRGLLDRYAEADVAVGVWDMTTDVGVAAFRCVILERGNNPFRRLGPIEGMGCHLVREVALARALTEAAQGRLTLIAGSRDDNLRDRYTATQEAELRERANERLSRPGTRSFTQAPTQLHETLEIEVAQILAELKRSGIDEAVCVDLTKPEFGIPVVRVVVPGLETYHHVPGYLPGPRATRQLRATAREALA
jgi:YcaO-like protein with predicted kinase domain